MFSLEEVVILTGGGSIFSPEDVVCSHWRR